MVAAVDNVISDRASATFGIRSVSSHLTKDGYIQFVINGKPVLIRGAGWAPDMFLRDDPKRMETEFSYVVNLGLNTIRSEGKLEDARFYDLADRDGIMILAGWECCDKWESWAKTGGEPWNSADEKVAADSMASEARLLRNHPSVIGFLIGSDNAPPAGISKRYVDALRAADWPLPIIAAAVPQATPETGPSGMKMDGPYSWVPPAYWYADKLGGAFGFDSEVSAGASIPLLDDLNRMLSPQELEALWKDPQARQFHASAAWSVFATIEPFDTALAKRYGPPKSLEDYVAKSQLENYDNARAQFEAFNAHMDAAKPSTGVIYWMLNNAWPSLHWHLYDYFLNPAGTYFGAKIANEEKIFSLFEPHTQLFNRGKQPHPIQFGHSVLIVEDAVGYIDHYRIVENTESDETIVVGEMRQVKEHLPNLKSASFDSGFHVCAHGPNRSRLWFRRIEWRYATDLHGH
jgi:exo-1,4-beta-D-glucosaminidase